MTEPTIQLEQLASRAVSLYTRPTVALELVRLAEEPVADAQLLKECVAQDPALACRLLRVVNSSLFGLNRPVGDLNQAIGLLGIKPLKLLVLGFSLPDSLFAEVAARELEWYWTNTLTRAVAARMLSEQLWHQPGDEAFIAGLLQDIGILVLIRELGEPYVRFLTGVIDEQCHLALLEQDTLGFDHLQLSAALLAKWQLPQRLVDAVAAPKRTSRLERLSPPEGDLPQILHLAEMLMQLVGQERLDVLPDLLEAGKIYRGMTKSKLTELVEGLQPQVDQLAEVLSVELTEERDYVQMLVEAQRHMAVLGEEIAGESSTDDDLIYEQLLSHTGELTDAMQTFLAGKRLAIAKGEHKSRSHASHDGQHRGGKFGGKKSEESPERATLLRKLVAVANRCRERRTEMSLLLIEPNVFDLHSDPLAVAAGEQTRAALLAACERLDPEKVAIFSQANQGSAAIISNCERRAAVAVARNAISELTRLVAAEPMNDCDITTTLSIGVATVSVVPKNFDPAQIVESAMRCLSAARACGTSAVKSIEL
ncbi:MAG TPA: HDOD domain-containing protein [Lacipirellulaceae bacterium]|jgi:HD-like signal output (HDOD) protein|nr:HDOD domain-containing protein [Lacipirellulaceae bacterium]